MPSKNKHVNSKVQNELPQQLPLQTSSAESKMPKGSRIHTCNIRSLEPCKPVLFYLLIIWLVQKLQVTFYSSAQS